MTSPLAKFAIILLTARIVMGSILASNLGAIFIFIIMYFDKKDVK